MTKNEQKKAEARSRSDEWCRRFAMRKIKVDFAAAHAAGMRSAEARERRFLDAFIASGDVEVKQ